MNPMRYETRNRAGKLKNTHMLTGAALAVSLVAGGGAVAAQDAGEPYDAADGAML